MVDRVPSKRRRIMREFIIKEISGVDVPAQAHARVALMKRDDSAKKDYGSSPTASAISQEIQAVDFDTVLAEHEAREAAREVTNNLREKWSALQRSFDTIACDESVAPADKISSMQESLRQFISSLREERTAIAESMTKSLSAVPALAGLLAKDGNEGDEPMTEAEKKQIDDLTKSVADLTKQLEAATAKEPAKKAADLQKELDTATAQLAEATGKLEAAEAAKAEAVAKAGMSDDEKAAMDKMDAKDKAEWMKLSPEERKKKMKKAVDEDPVIYKSADGTQEFRKSDDPRLVAMAKRADESDKLAKAEAEKRETAELTKRADEEPYKHFAGEPTEKVAALRALSRITDEDARKALEKMLEIGGKAVAAAFKTIGHKNESIRKAAADFEKKITDIQARDKSTRTEAMTKARQEDPEAYQAYQDVGAN